MGHAHLAVRHLLKQLETQGRRQRPVRPDWVTSIIHEVAELFEPRKGVGRVGFDCRFNEDRWEVTLYLGKKEIVGGKDDGQARFVDFGFDLSRLYRFFNLVERFDWNVPCSSGAHGENHATSSVMIEGYWGQNPVRLKFFATPPSQVGPGLRDYADGRCEPV